MPLTHVHRRRQKPKMCLTVRPIGVREDKRDKDGNMMREQKGVKMARGSHRCKDEGSHIREGLENEVII